MWLVKKDYGDKVKQLFFETLTKACDHIANTQDAYSYEIIFIAKDA
jgi:hypothetical protein